MSVKCRRVTKAEAKAALTLSAACGGGWVPIQQAFEKSIEFSIWFVGKLDGFLNGFFYTVKSPKMGS